MLTENPTSCKLLPFLSHWHWHLVPF
jgi:hypothetical protein